MRCPFIGKQLGLLFNWIRKIQFAICFFEKKRLYREFMKCESKADFFDFSGKILTSHQIKSEIVNFLEFVEERKPSVVCEIGTAEGGTNFLLGQSISSVNVVIGVDLLINNTAQLRYYSRPGNSHEYITGSSYDEETVRKVDRVLRGRDIDLLFIDGDHAYEGVKKDFEKYRGFVKQGGVIVFHDIVPDYKTRYNKDTGRWAGDVPVFWNEIKQDYEHFEFVENSDQDGLGIGVLINDKK